MIVVDSHEAHQAEDNARAPEDVCKPIGPRSITSNQDAGVFCDKTSYSADGEEEDEIRKGEHPYPNRYTA